MLIKRRKKHIIYFMKIELSSIGQAWIPFTLGCFVPNLVEIGHVVLEKNIFIFLYISSMYFCYFVIISSWKMRGPLFEQTWIPFTQGCIVPRLVEIGQVVLEKRIFNFINVFSLFLNYLPLKIEWSSLFKPTYLPLTQVCFEQVWFKWPSGFWEEEF